MDNKYGSPLVRDGALGKTANTTKVIAYDYEGDVQGTLCVKCHKLFTKQDATWLDGSKALPMYKHELQSRDPNKDLFFDCGECGKAIWGKADI